MKRFSVTVFCFFLLIALLLSESVANSPVKDEGMVGGNAPKFNVSDIDGNPLSLESLLETYQAVILNFWGLRCGACIEEMPHLNEIFRKYNGKITILGVNVDAVDGASLKEYMKKTKIAIDYVVVPDPEFTMVDTYNMMAAPLTVVIDKTGIVRYYHENFEPGDEKQLDQVIQNVLDGKKVVVK